MMINSKKKILRNAIAILSAWIGLMIVVYSIIGIHWFNSGDFSFRSAMAYHGILIPAWMMLMIAYLQHFKQSDLMMKLYFFGAIFGGIFSSIGALLIHSQGINFGTIVQVLGMIIAEITALTIIIEFFIYYFRNKNTKINKLAWWTVSVALIGLSVATPLGHIAGAAKDLGKNFPLFIHFTKHLGLSVNDTIDGFIGSHSHQIIAAFLAAAFSMPFLQKSDKKFNIISSTETIGLILVLIATLAQVFLYQYCAWSGWEPPTLFSTGLNGIPLDDFILSILGFGFVFFIPSLWLKTNKKLSSENYSLFTKRTVSIILIAYLISVVILGIFIEFHEQYFGQGQSLTPGVANDLAFIRAHIIFGFMIIPVLLSILLNFNLLEISKQKNIFLWFNIATIITGVIGVFIWTFLLNSIILKISLFLSVIFLFMFAFQVQKMKKH